MKEETEKQCATAGRPDRVGIDLVKNQQWTDALNHRTRPPRGDQELPRLA